MIITVRKDLLSRLKANPVLCSLYGIGNGADKIFDTCSNYGIEILGVFASDGVVTKSGGRRRCFRGMTIMSYSEAKEKFAHRDYVILLCFEPDSGSAIGQYMQDIRGEGAACSGCTCLSGQRAFYVGVLQEEYR